MTRRGLRNKASGQVIVVLVEQGFIPPGYDPEEWDFLIAEPPADDGKAWRFEGSPATGTWVEIVPPVSRLDALIALLVAKGTITQAEANALPE
jgi:hypothetical protein